MDGAPTEINVVTLNCWGLKYLSKLRRERLSEVGRRLATSDPSPHIVALQECWTQEDYESIRRETRFVLPYGKFYFSGVLGAGLAILSRWPIEESSMVAYPLNGKPTAFYRGDWFVGKGVACARIRYGPGPTDVVEVFNTHTHAPYAKEPHRNSYLCHRVSQAWELAKLLSGAVERGHLVLGLGDFNMLPLSLCHRLITSHAPGVRDAWRVLHPDSSVGASDDPAELARRRPIPTADFNVRENGATSDSVYCTWRWPKDQQRRLLRAGGGKDRPHVPPDAIDRKGKRLDYVFASSGRRWGGSEAGDAAGGEWVVQAARVGMLEPHPTLGVSLSDHFAVEVTLTWMATGSSSHPALQQQQQQQQDGDTGADEKQKKHVATSHLSRGDSVISPASPPASVVEAQGQSQLRHRRDSSAAAVASAVNSGAFLSSPTVSEFKAGSGTSSPPVPLTPPPTRVVPPPTSAAVTSAAAVDPVSPVSNHSAARLPSATYDEILALIHAYVARERAERRWRAAHFFVWLAAWVGGLVAVWFVPSYGAFVLMLVCGLGLAWGVVDGLIALLFFGAELRTLMEWEWEVRNAKAAAVGGPATSGVGLRGGW